MEGKCRYNCRASAGGTTEVLVDVFIQDHDGNLTRLESLQGITLEQEMLYWIDAYEPTSEDLANIEQALPIKLVEERKHSLEHPEIRVEQEFLFLRWQFLEPSKSGAIRRQPLELYLGANFLLCIHHYPRDEACEVPKELSDFLEDERTPQQSAGQLLYRILLGSLENYWNVSDTLSLDIMSDQEQVFSGDPDDQAVSKLRSYGGRNLELRGLVAAHRHVVRRLVRGDVALIPTETANRFIDVYDQLNGIEIEIQNNNDIITSSYDMELNIISNRLNEWMKKLTIVATIFLPLAFLVGVYGMNFKNMPELGWRFGYLLSWILLLVIGLGMYALAMWLTSDRRIKKKQRKKREASKKEGGRR